MNDFELFLTVLNHCTFYFYSKQINPRFWFYIGSDVLPVLHNQGCPVTFPTPKPSSNNIHETIVRVVVPPKAKEKETIDKDRTSSEDKTDHDPQEKITREPLPESRHRLTLPDSKGTPTGTEWSHD
jgi:hypothetical protein